MENQPINEEQKVKNRPLTEEHQDYLFMVALSLLGSFCLGIVALGVCEILKLLE